MPPKLLCSEAAFSILRELMGLEEEDNAEARDAALSSLSQSEIQLVNRLIAEWQTADDETRTLVCLCWPHGGGTA